MRWRPHRGGLVVTTRSACRVLLLALTLVLAIPGVASASRRLQFLGLEAGGGITLTNRGARAISETDTIPFNMNSRGRLFREFPKIARSPEGNIGELTSILIEEARGPFGEEAQVRWLGRAGVPSILLYREFLGTLPNITGVLVIARNFSFEFTFNFFATRCLFEAGAAGMPLLLEFPAEAGGATLVRTLRPNTLTLMNGPIELCGGRAELEATMRLRPGLALRLL